MGSKKAESSRETVPAQEPGLKDAPHHDEGRAGKKSRAGVFKRWLWIILALTFFVVVVLYLIEAEDTVDVSQTTAQAPAQLVSIEHVTVGPQMVEVSSFAEIRPRWSAELRSAVSGRVTEVLPSALAGERVAAGTALITIESSRYLAELAAAEQAHKEAKLALWQAENASLVARKEYERSRRKPPNELALKLPQLEIAQSAVKASDARVSAARRQLDDTAVAAPFSGFVTERFVSLGQSVNPGDPLIKLVDNSSFELEVELGRRDWLLLKQPIAGREASVIDQTGAEIARATVRQGGGFLDEKTRQFKVYLEIVPSNGKPVLSGDFVRVVLPGISVPAALDIPESAYTQEGYVWYLDDQDRLKRMSPEVLFRRPGRIVIKAPDSMHHWRIAITPLVSFLPGQKTRPKVVEG